MSIFRFGWSVFALFAAAWPARAAGPLPVPAPAAERVAAIEVNVAPDRADWTYPLGAPARFTIRVLADGGPLAGVEVRYRAGLEMMPAEERRGITAADGTLVVDAGTLREPGFLRCVATVEEGGRAIDGLGTAGFSPGRIAPTQANPPDFDAFWTAQKAEAARLPLDPVLTPLPELNTAKAEAFQVSLQNIDTGYGASRFYGVLHVPRGAGPCPALLVVPGAGARPYRGRTDFADCGFLTLQVGIHGIPINLSPVTYDSLSAGALAGYRVAGLVSRERCYFRRVYIGCLRAAQYLAGHPRWDGRHLIVLGGSQGGQLAIVTAALEPRVTALAANYPAYCDVTGYLHGRAGGWPHMMRDPAGGFRTPEQIATTAYYDTVNFARRLRAPGYYMWGYNDDTCPPTSMFAAFNVITAPKTLCLALERGHGGSPEFIVEPRRWVLLQAGLDPNLAQGVPESIL